MKGRIESQKIAERLKGNDSARNGLLFPAKDGIFTGTVSWKTPSMFPSRSDSGRRDDCGHRENTAGDFGYTEGEVPVWNGLQNFFTKPFPEFHDPLLMTRRTQVPSFAGKCEQKLVAAFSRPDTCRTMMKDASIEVAVNNVFDIRPEKTILLCKALVIALFQRFKTCPVKCRFAAFLWTI